MKGLLLRKAMAVASKKPQPLLAASKISRSMSFSTSTTSSSPRVLVVGSGVIGLRTAIELTRQNVDVDVVLRSPVHPLRSSNCSQGAGGLWMPFHCDDERTDKWAIETLDEIYPLATDDTNDLVNMQYVVSLKQKHLGPQTADFVADDYDRGTGGSSELPRWSNDDRLHFQNVTLEQVAWQNQVMKLRLPPLHLAFEAGYHHAWMFQAPIIDSPKMLQQMILELELSQIDINVETGVYYKSLDEMVEEAVELGCDTIVNATGLGSQSICQDSKLVGARGVLLTYDRSTCRRKPAKQEELTSASGPFMMPVEQVEDCCVLIEDSPWGSNEFPCYTIVRGDTIVVGGSYLEGDDMPTIRPDERDRLLENARIMGIESAPTGEWVGFRPYRQTTRIEMEQKVAANDKPVRVVHSYGTGGSGWTIYTGVAKETSRLIMDT